MCVARHMDACVDLSAQQSKREAHRALMVAGDWEGRQSMSRSLRAPKAVWQRFRCSHSEPVCVWGGVGEIGGDGGHDGMIRVRTLGGAVVAVLEDLQVRQRRPVQHQRRLPGLGRLLRGLERGGGLVCFVCCMLISGGPPQGIIRTVHRSH